MSSIRQGIATPLIITGLAFIIIVGAVIVHIVFPSVGPKAESFPLILYMMVAAITGALVNQPKRQRDLEGLAATRVIGYYGWKCGVAVAFAFIFYEMCVAGLISGDMFPRFSNADKPYENMRGFLFDVDPESYKDAAKIIVWSFVAGYSERFVPNLLSKIGKGAELHS